MEVSPGFIPVPPQHRSISWKRKPPVDRNFCLGPNIGSINPRGVWPSRNSRSIVVCPVTGIFFIDPELGSRVTSCWRDLMHLGRSSDRCRSGCKRQWQEFSEHLQPFQSSAPPIGSRAIFPTTTVFGHISPAQQLRDLVPCDTSSHPQFSQSKSLIWVTLTDGRGAIRGTEHLCFTLQRHANQYVRDRGPDSRVVWPSRPA